MKIFYKERKPNGRRHVYFCGMKIFSYKRRFKNKNGESLNSLVSEKKDLTVQEFFELKNKACAQPALYGQDYENFLGRYGAWIGPNSFFKGCPVFPHKFYGIFISNGAKIGKNCTIFHQVTIGSNNLEGSTRRGCPIIGDNVYIGAGAKIIGKCVIGNNVRIGANAVVVEDVPDDTVVVNQKCRYISKKNMCNDFIVLGEEKDETVL